MTNAEMYIFIGKCLVMDDDPSVKEEVSGMVSGGRIPWELFVWMGSSHLVLPALYSSFERNGLIPLLPDDLVQHLRNIYQLNLRRNLKIMDQCREIAGLLNPVGMEPVFMKGVGFLLSELYKDPGDRMMEDIDLLLPAEDISKAISRIQDAGYKTYEGYEDEEPYSDHHHMPPMFHRERPAPVEIHHSAVHAVYSGMVPTKDILNEAVRIKTFRGHLADPESSENSSEDAVRQHDGNGMGSEGIRSDRKSMQTEGVTETLNIRIPAIKHCQLLTFLQDHRANRGYLSSLGTLKGLYDFHRMAKLRKPQPTDVPNGRFRNKYERYCYATGKLFNSEALKAEGDIPQLNRYWKKQLFYLNHPGWDAFYHDYLYASVIFIGLLISSLWSGTSGRLVKKKIRKVLGRKKIL